MAAQIPDKTLVDEMTYEFLDACYAKPPRHWSFASISFSVIMFLWFLSNLILWLRSTWCHTLVSCFSSKILKLILTYDYLRLLLVFHFGFEYDHILTFQKIYDKTFVYSFLKLTRRSIADDHGNRDFIWYILVFTRGTFSIWQACIYSM